MVPDMGLPGLHCYRKTLLRLMNLSARARLARWTLVLAACGSLFIFAARCLDLQLALPSWAPKQASVQ